MSKNLHQITKQHSKNIENRIFAKKPFFQGKKTRDVSEQKEKTCRIYFFANTL